MKKILLFLPMIFAIHANAQNYPYQVVNASEAYNGVFGQVYITFKYINPANPVLQRPLIVAEGYDYGEILSPEEPFGATDIRTGFLNEARDPFISQQLAQLLDGGTQQYDVVYVDWRNGTDYLERNALVLEEVIRRVNGLKVPVNGVIQPNVLLGFSMGGVLSRYALKDMEDKGQNHQTRLFISWDAPHQGAVVPRGFGHMLRQARDVYVQTGPVGSTVDIIRFMRGEMVPGNAVNLADRPASRQLLVNHINPLNQVDNSMYNSWQTTRKNKGNPTGGLVQNFRMIAVSNGSECAQPQEVPPGGNLLTYYGKGNTKILSDLGASGIGLSTIGTFLNQPSLVIFGTLPGRNDFEIDVAVNSQADGVSNQVYRGKVTYKKKVLWLIPVNTVITNRSYNSDASTYPYEYYAGGNIPLKERGLDLSAQAYSDTWIKYNITASNASSFGFVPVPSALDIGSGNVALTKTDYLTPYRWAVPPAAPKSTPFTNGFITAFNGSPDNEPHIQVNRRNGDWMAGWLQNTNPVAFNCSFACSGTGVTGPDFFCNTPSGPYNIPNLPNLPAGASLTWRTSNSAIATPNTPGALNTTLARNGNGSINLFVDISNSGCGAMVTLRKDAISVGLPAAPGPISFPLIDPTMGRIHASITAVPGATSYNWYINGSLHNTHHGTLAIIPISKTACDIEYDIAVETVNNCGVSARTHANAYVPCDNMFMISPNPASDEVTVTADQSKTIQNADNSFDEVRVYDFQSNLKKSQRFNKAKTGKINLSGLPNGNYYIEIMNGKYKERKQLIIQK